MLILTRRPSETINIGQDVTVTVLGINGYQVRIGINAPKSVAVHREEIFLRINGDASNQANANKSLGHADNETTKVLSPEELAAWLMNEADTANKRGYQAAASNLKQIAILLIQLEQQRRIGTVLSGRIKSAYINGFLSGYNQPECLNKPMYEASKKANRYVKRLEKNQDEERS